MPDTQPLRFPLTVTPQNRDETTAKDAKLVNGFVEVGTAEGEAWVYKRPGLLQNVAVTAAAGSGCFLWNGHVYSIFGGTLYQDTNPVVGTVDSSGGVYSWGTCLGGTPKLFFQNGVRAYTYDSVNGIVAIPTTTTVVLTGTISHGSAVISGLSSTASLLVGATVTITGVGTSTIKSIDSSTQVTLNSALSLPAQSFTYTTGAVASAPFPTSFTLSGISPTTANVSVGATLLNSDGSSPIANTTISVASVPSSTQIVFSTPAYITWFNNGAFSIQNQIQTGSITFVNPGFPAVPFTKGYAYLDGTGYVLTTASYVMGSDFNNLQSWPALNSIAAMIEPDAGVFMAKQLSYVLALKQYSIEIFRDAGNPVGSPLASVDGAKVTVGCRHAGSVRTMEGMLFCIGQVKGGAMQVIMLENLHAVTISTRAIERLLQAWDYSVIYSWVARIDGHNFYGITSKVSNMTLVYDTVTKVWAQWTDVNGNYFPIVDSTNNTNQVPILQHETNGKLYALSSTTYTDDGSIFTVDIYTPIFDGGTKKRKYLKLIDIVSDQATKGTLQVRNSDDDYQTWTNFRLVDLSKRRPFLANCGTFFRRAYHLRHTVNAPLRIRAIEMQLDIGTL